MKCKHCEKEIPTAESWHTCEPSEVSSADLLSDDECRILQFIHEGKSFSQIHRYFGMHLNDAVIIRKMMSMIKKFSDNAQPDEQP